jgi:DNA-binding transcriptional LysR family regulator
VARHGPFERLEDFLRVPVARYSLLTWPTWLGSAFGRPIDPNGSYFDDAMSVLEAVAGGMGLTVITRVASAAMLDSGRLVLAHPHAAAGRDYHATLTDAGNVKPAARTFFDWLISCDNPGHALKA